MQRRTTEFEALTKTRGPPRPKRYSPLDDATSLVSKIYKMKAHLTRYGHDYLKTYGCLPGACIMTDERRDSLDKDVEDFIELCNDKVRILNHEIRLGSPSEQVLEHRKEVIKMVMRLLNDFVAYYAYLRGVRMKRNYDKEQFDRVESCKGRISPSQEFESMICDNISLDTLNSLTDEAKNSLRHRNSDNKNQISPDQFQQWSQQAAEHDTSLSTLELQALDRENSLILDELQTLNDQVKSIGKKVVQISKLQELFTEKVMEQEQELSNLHETAIRSSENVRDANDLIRDAMMKNASTRVLILFYIVVLGFTVLFLDWYNP